MAVTELIPGTRLRNLTVEAVGDDFAQVSGEWLEGVRVAQLLSQADHAWAFAARAEAVPLLMEALFAPEGSRVIGIAPGRRPGWEAEGRYAVERLLCGEIPADWEAGLLLVMPAPACGGGCTGCCGTNGGCGALYPCNKKSTDQSEIDGRMNEHFI